MVDFSNILNLISTGVGAYEKISKNNDANEIIAKGTDTSDIREKQLADSQALFNMLYGSNPAMQADLQQLDQNFLLPAVGQFQPQYETAAGRYQEGERYSPETLRSLLATKARAGVDDAYDKVTNATSMQALRTGTNAAETLTELAKQRAKDTAKALTDAELQSITGSESMNLARNESNQKGLATTQSPLMEALKLRGGAASNEFLSGAQTRDTAARGLFNNISTGYGSEAAARAGGVAPAMKEMLSEQPFGTAIKLGGDALGKLFTTPTPAPATALNETTRLPISQM